MSLLNQQGNIGNLQGPIQGGNNPLDVVVNTVSSAVSTIGSIFPVLSSSSGISLPASFQPNQQAGIATRNMAYWFVPEVGVVNMYINPQTISYNYRKLIQPERTKGGYIVQYWGEELTTLIIQGHTGSSSVNGLNVLENVYRAEQYLFDPLAQTMAVANSITGLNGAVDSSLGNIGGLSGIISNGTNGALQLSPSSQNILPRYVPSLASLAMGIEFYYDSWRWRGFFTSFSFKESAERLGLFDYDIAFTSTQRTGMRYNSLPWTHSAVDGPSNWDTNPLSISTLASTVGNTNFTGTGTNNGPFST
jgi:hypothetical protein